VVLVAGPLWAGLAVPRWRPGIAVALWAFFVVSCIGIMLLLFALAQALSQMS
jgi:hypothetical protein